MRDLSDYGAIAKKQAGEGTITFPLGATIQTAFELIEYSSGKRVLSCLGWYGNATYPSWQALVDQYLPGQTSGSERKQGAAQKYEGRTATNQRLRIQQMFLMGAEASVVDKRTMLLRMQFD